MPDQKEAVSEGDADCKEDAARIDVDKKVRLEEQKNRSKANEMLDLVDGYLKEHAKDEWLIGGLAGVEEQLGDLLSKQNELFQKEAAQEATNTALELAVKSLDDCQTQSGIRKQELEDASEQLQQGKDAFEPATGGPLVA